MSARYLNRARIPKTDSDRQDHDQRLKVLLLEFFEGAALSVLMRIPEEERARYAADALHRVATSSENEYRRFLLGELVEAYAELDEEQQADFETLIQSPNYEEVHAMGVTTYEKGIEQGQRNLVIELLEQHLGPVTDEIRQQVERWPVDRLSELNYRISQAKSLDDIDWDPQADVGKI